MALIVETGLVVAGADSYVSLTYAEKYHENRANVTWASATDEAKEAALRKATQYVDGRYYGRWKGCLLTALQSRQWPRFNVQIDAVYGFASENFDQGFARGLIPNNIVPEPVKQATCELALRALSGDLAKDLDRGGLVSSVRVGPITKTFEKNAPGQTVYTIVEQLLAPFLAPANGMQIVRS
jgi:hypothetical protein